jgi:hypothetical protein
MLPEIAARGGDVSVEGGVAQSVSGAAMPAGRLGGFNTAYCFVGGGFRDADLGEAASGGGATETAGEAAGGRLGGFSAAIAFGGMIDCPGGVIALATFC